jgi:tRNA(Ile)-lysidine synthase
MRRAVPPALVERFRSDWVAAGGEAPERLGLAVSGGPDSLALLLLACAAWPDRVAAATVDHGIRAEAAAEAVHVAAICRMLGCPHAVLGADVTTSGKGLQAAAREARYAALARWAGEQGLAFLATGHHADDQAETLVMRLMRGSGLAGLSGIRASRREGALTIVRPLLGWSKSELVHIVAEAGFEPVDDPSNGDERFDRTRARRLVAEAEIDTAALARSAGALGEAEEAIEWATSLIYAARVSAEADALSFSPRGIPREMLRRLVVRVLAQIAEGAEPRGEEVMNLLAALSAGRAATLSGVKGEGGETWRFTRAPARRVTSR